MSRFDDGRRNVEDGAGGSGSLDAAIDRAVRAVFDAEPAAALRERVVQRLESRRRRAPWVWAAAPLAAGALLVLAVIVPWRTGTPVPPPRDAKAAMRSPAPDVAVPASGTALRESTAVKHIDRPPSGARPRPRDAGGATPPGVTAGATVERAADAVDVAALAQISRIEIAPLARPVVTPEAVTITPLPRPLDIRVSPLSVPERHN